MIKMILLDVDGCLTDGKIVYSENGDEIKAFNVKDGLAIKAWINLGFEVAIITGRQSKIVRRRADELGITHLYQGVKDKATLVSKLCNELGITLEEMAAIGDDLNDYRMLQNVGIAFVPHNASRHVKEIANVILEERGGEGAVREMIEMMIRHNGKESDFLASWT